MKSEFSESIFNELYVGRFSAKSSIIKSKDVTLTGQTKISVDEEAHEGVKLIIKKDSDDNVKEIKFICSCGHTKSIILDYSDQ